MLAPSMNPALTRYTGYLFVVDLDGNDDTTGDIMYRSVAVHESWGLISLNATVSGITARVSTYKIKSETAKVLGGGTSWDPGARALKIQVASDQILLAGRLYIFLCL